MSERDDVGRQGRRQSKGKRSSVHELRQLRTLRGVTQAQVALVMGVLQPAVCKLEQRRDPGLNELRRYVEALGGELTITARFPEAVVELLANHDDAAPSSR